MKDLTEIRKELMDQHASLKLLAAKVRELAERPSGADARDQLSGLLHELGDGIDAHNAREEHLLGEVLPTLDAWGSERLTRMDNHHREEHREIAEQIRAAGELPEFPAAVNAALPAIEKLMAHMREEEKEFLGRDLLRDDVINIHQSDG
ncbi:MAG: hemerythrin domain-containing protein [Gemmatimonadota bacterium]|nr:hemerythrin domain-containing protein [Gemmatimonadota bacterium]